MAWGYDTLPSIRTYGELASRLMNTKPIRGRDPLVYPFSNRRGDCDRFSFRMFGDTASQRKSGRYGPIAGSKDGDIELLFYGRPFVVWHRPTATYDNNERITISTIGLHATDGEYLSNLLCAYLYRAYISKGKLVLKTEAAHQDKEPAIFMRSNETVTFVLDPQTRTFKREDGATQTMLRLNRTETNNVRKQYGDFYRFVKGMIGVRKMTRREADPNASRYMYDLDEQVVTFPVDEFASFLPFQRMPDDPHSVNTPLIVPASSAMTKTILTQGPYPVFPIIEPEFCVNPMWKPKQVETLTNHKQVNGYWQSFDTLTTEPHSRWLHATERFLAMISTPEGDPDRHVKFAQAFALLGLYKSHQLQRWATQGWSVPDVTIVAVKGLRDALDEILFKYHSDRVIESAPVPPGIVPSNKYVSWVNR